MNDRRTAPRHTGTQRAVPTTALLSGGTALPGSILDISPDGARVAGDTQDLAVGDEITLTLLFPLLEQTIEHSCRVRHVQPGQSFGVQFHA